MVLAGCGNDRDSGKKTRIVSVYIWADYIAPDTIGKFESEYGIKVNYNTYDSSEVVDVKLLAGSSGYDVVAHNNQFSSRLAPIRVFEKLDFSQLDNMRNLDAETLRKIEYAPVRDYNIPYHCGVTLLDGPTDLFSMVLAYLRRDPNAVDDESLAVAEAQLKSVRPYIRYFSNQKSLSDLPNCEFRVGARSEHAADVQLLEGEAWCDTGYQRTGVADHSGHQRDADRRLAGGAQEKQLGSCDRLNESSAVRCRFIDSTLVREHRQVPFDVAAFAVFHLGKRAGPVVAGLNTPGIIRDYRLVGLRRYVPQPG